MLRHTWFIILLILGPLSVSGQQTSEPYLLLQKAGTQKKVIFKEGDEIRYRLKGEEYFRRSAILGLHRDTIRFHYFDVPLSDLEVIDIKGRNFQNFHFNSGGNKVIIAGFLFLVGDYVSQELIRDEQGGLSGETYAIAGGIISVGIVMKLLEKRKFRPGGRYIIDIIDLRVR